MSFIEKFWSITLVRVDKLFKYVKFEFEMIYIIYSIKLKPFSLTASLMQSDTI